MCRWVPAHHHGRHGRRSRGVDRASQTVRSRGRSGAVPAVSGPTARARSGPSVGLLHSRGRPRSPALSQTAPSARTCPADHDHDTSRTVPPMARRTAHRADLALIHEERLLPRWRSRSERHERSTHARARTALIRGCGPEERRSTTRPRTGATERTGTPTGTRCADGRCPRANRRSCPERSAAHAG